jgi:hypothetical protein
VVVAPHNVRRKGRRENIYGKDRKKRLRDREKLFRNPGLGHQRIRNKRQLRPKSGESGNNFHSFLFLCHVDQD